MTQLVLHLVLTLMAMARAQGQDQSEASDGSKGGSSGEELARIINGCEWTSRQNVISEILLERYRKYVMDRFFLLKDVCAVYEWNKNLKEPEFNQVEEVEDGKNNDDFRNTREQIQDDDNEDSSPVKQPTSAANSTCSKSAKDAFICLSNQLGDPTMNAIILDNLELICDPRYSSAASAQKRSKYVSKQKFFSWGGKRNNANVFYPWGGKRNTVGRVHRQPKVVIRNPFHSWGGKRNDPRDELEDY